MLRILDAWTLDDNYDCPKTGLIGVMGTINTLHG